MKSVLSLFLLFSVPQAVLTYGVKIPKTNSIEKLAKNTEIINKRGSNNRILHGFQVEIDEYSSAASIMTSFPDYDWIETCTGVFISKNVVLTAAHCVYNTTMGQALPNDITVSGGSEMSAQSSNSDNLYTVDDLYVHSEFKETQESDMALLFLSNDITDPRISFAKIYNLPITDDTPVEAAGWGNTNEDGVSGETNYLRAVKLFISSSEVCAENNDYWESNDGDNVCTVTRDGEGTCFGDSGGPLYFTGNSSKPILGITRYGANYGDEKKQCGLNGYPNYFTNAFSYIDWILDNTDIDEKDLVYDTSSLKCDGEDCDKEGPGGAGSGTDGSGEDGSGEDGSEENGSGENGSGEEGPQGAGSGEGGSGEKGPEEHDGGKITYPEDQGIDGQGSNIQGGPEEYDDGKVTYPKDHDIDGKGSNKQEDSGEEDPEEEDSGEDGSGEEDPEEEDSGEDGSGEEDSGEEDPEEEDSGEEDSGEEDSGEGNSGEEDSE
ncbi:hypothetical protein BB559_002688 [Furculomyces boomerangus]|uniref:Peptidase S1 domain-containing protein n=1 Tax=Furculomyces boomerangus TaxID=61424 RepID=A0A2T9Y1P6_9FUNG|nr:hypothetical protein BB559_006583 [Furculomyces boomerangus]PVU95593.1 hypothetical protein BB559_002688 [Furculomyces boomerangus]